MMKLINIAKKKIEWFASAWDLNSQKFKQYNLKYNKIASAMIVNIELLKEVANETYIYINWNEYVRRYK